jgi:1-acyl-sn-glycerol-3-phosphate acyltransferase
LYFPEGGVPDDESLFWIRLRMVHSDLLLNIKFNSSYFFADNKRDSLILFFSGGPDKCVKIHKQIETFGKTGLDRRHIREEVRDVIYTQLVALRINQKRKTDVCKKVVKRVGHGQLFFSFMRL